MDCFTASRFGMTPLGKHERRACKMIMNKVCTQTDGLDKIGVGFFAGGEGWRIAGDTALGQTDASSTMRSVLHGEINYE
jgi:hypothetical protein